VSFLAAGVQRRERLLLVADAPTDVLLEWLAPIGDVDRLVDTGGLTVQMPEMAPVDGLVVTVLIGYARPLGAPRLHLLDLRFLCGDDPGGELSDLGMR
jgi:hypothetical protein